MAQFTTAERLNAAFKQVFKVLGTSNTDDALGKMWYEELYSSKASVLQRHIWTDSATITYSPLLADAQALAAANPTIVQDNTAVYVTLTQDTTSNGRLWLPRVTPGDETAAILLDWIQPNDFPNPAGQPSNGFSLQLFDGANTPITATEGAWAPYYPLGAIILGNGQTVGSGELAAYIPPLKIGGFRYIGTLGGGGGTPMSYDNIVTAELEIQNLDNTLYTGNHVRMVVIDSSGNVVSST